MTFDWLRNMGSPAVTPQEHGIAGEAILKGDALAYGTSGDAGTLVKATAVSTEIVGIAGEGAADGAEFGYYPALEGVIFRGETTGNMTAALINTACDLEIVSNEYKVNEDAAATGIIRILGLMDYSAYGAPAEVSFTFVKRTL